jgi:hypothetical protein
MKTEVKPKRNVGRQSVKDPCRHRYYVKLNDADNARFLALYDASGLDEYAKLIRVCLFERELKVVKIDKAAMDYYMRLTTFHSQFRAIGTNYNQVTKAVKATFSERKAVAFLRKLEEATKELAVLCRRIEALTEEFERKWLRK